MQRNGEGEQAEFGWHSQLIGLVIVLWLLKPFALDRLPIENSVRFPSNAANKILSEFESKEAVQRGGFNTESTATSSRCTHCSYSNYSNMAIYTDLAPKRRRRPFKPPSSVKAVRSRAIVDDRHLPI